MCGRTRSLSRALRLLSAVAGAVAALLAVRFLFHLLIANPDNPIVPIVYTASRPFLFPWVLLWPSSTIPGLVVERATLAALAVYLVLGLALGLLSRSGAREGAVALDNQSAEETR